MFVVIVAAAVFCVANAFFVSSVTSPMYLKRQILASVLTLSDHFLQNWSSEIVIFDQLFHAVLGRSHLFIVAVIGVHGVRKLILKIVCRGYDA